MKPEIEFSTLLEHLNTGLKELSADLVGLRKELADLRSDLRSVREQNAREHAELFTSDGLSRLAAMQLAAQQQALQVRGVWAVLGVLIGFLASYSVYHLH